jgi:16S rRNA (cytosine1402-N4)-methyltransferase
MPSAAASFSTELQRAHVPVLLEELLAVLGVQKDSRVMDCTFGAGGHAAAVGALLGPQGLLVACDRDPVAEEYYLALAGRLRCPSQFLAGDFAHALETLREEGRTFTHIYMDLGVSSMQLDSVERGFSYSVDAPLDMRMDPSTPVTAAAIVNTWGEKDLAELFTRYGEERHSRRIARAIVRRREAAPFLRTADLVETIKDAIPTPARFAAGNPARRVFQALRIEVNGELDSLRRALPLAFSLLEPGGVLAVISFHSLEDRMVKEFFAARVRSCTCPPGFPVCVCGGKAEGQLVTPKAIAPSPREVAFNPRSSSARLRALRKF